MGLLGEKANEAYIPLKVSVHRGLWDADADVRHNSQNEKRTGEWLT